LLKGKKGTKNRHIKNSILKTSNIITIFLRLIFILTIKSEKNCKTKAKEIKEEIIPVKESLIPILVKSFAKKASATSKATKYSTVH
jgi:hypothetical protein